MTYTPPRERDAWFTIRGFAYQVDFTIVRWLDLKPDDCLELERGEDIDIVRNWAAGSESPSRLLEQVKHREGSLTLNSPEARAALANFIEHRGHNPTVRLQFRFVTTATVGRETKPRMPKGLRGLETWQSLREDKHDEVHRRRLLAALRGVLRRANAPDDVPAPVWTAYQDHIAKASEEQVRQLVLDFEWGLGQADPQSLREQIISRIQNLSAAKNEAHATQLYVKLFAHVFHLLATPGLKRLTTGNRSAILASPHPNDAAQRILERITDAISELEHRVRATERRLDGHDQDLEALRTEVLALGSASGMTTAVVATGVTPNLLPPPPPMTLVPRHEALAEVTQGLQTNNWVAIHGTSGSGKSELARQVAESLDGPIMWLALRDLDEPAATAHLVVGLSAMAGREPGTDRVAWLKGAARQLRGGALVADDLPRVSTGGALGRELTQLATALAESGARLLTSSPHELPARVTAQGGVACMVAPSLTIEETSLLLLSFGAENTDRTTALARFLNGLTAGHAELLVTAAAFLKQREWAVSEQGLKELLSGGYASDLQRDVLHRVVSTVRDQEARELLFRTAEIGGSFSKNIVGLVAEVDPQVRHPFTVLASLVGLWIQPQGGQRYSVCPLAKDLGKELDTRTRSSVNDALGTEIMRRKEVGPYDVLAAIAHLMKAGQQERAGVAYLMALDSVDSDDLPSSDGGLFQLWTDSALPTEMSLALRVYIRSLQVPILHAMGKELAFLATDLLDLSSSVSDPSHLLPILPSVHLLAKFDFARTSQVVVRILCGQETLTTPHGKPFVFLEGVGPGRFLWHLASLVGGPADLGLWLESLSQIPEASLRGAAAGEAFEFGVVGVCDDAWVRESRKDVREQDWDGVLDQLTRIQAEARKVGLAHLEAASLRAQMTVNAEYRKDFVAAERLGLAAIREHETQPGPVFLLRECLGRQYLYAGHHSKAVATLREALASECSNDDVTRLYARLSLVQALGHDAQVEAPAAALDAVATARSSRRLPRTELVKALGETAIAVYRTEGARAAFPYIDEAAFTLLGARNASLDWRDLAVAVAHIVVYLRTLVDSESANAAPSIDGEPIAEPKPGMVFKQHATRHTLFSEERVHLLRVCMAHFADAVNDDERLGVWLSEATVAGSAVTVPAAAIFLALFEGVDLVARGSLREGAQRAIDAQLPTIGALHVILMLTAALAGKALNDPTSAAAEGRELGRWLRTIPTGVDDPSLWNQVILVVETGCDPTASAAPIEALLKDDDALDYVKVAAMLALSSRGDQVPGYALSAHINAAIHVLRQRRVFMQLHRRLLLPFICEYWRQVTEKAGFLFRGPAQTREAIAIAAQAPVAIRAQRVLREVAWSLRASCPPMIEAWLNQKDSS